MASSGSGGGGNSNGNGGSNHNLQRPSDQASNVVESNSEGRSAPQEKKGMENEKPDGKTSWVQVFGSNSKPPFYYYWNAFTQTVAATIPPGETASWGAAVSPQKRRYFFPLDGGASVWTLPASIVGTGPSRGEIGGEGGSTAGPERVLLQHLESYCAKASVARWIQLPEKAGDVGGPLMVSGLTGPNRARFNGCVGQLVRLDEEDENGRAFLLMPEVLGGFQLEVPLCSVLPIPAGTIVQCAGLEQAPELNGQVGIVVAQDEESVRYVVRFQPGVEKSFRAIRLRACSRLWDVTLQPRYQLKWKTDMNCQFVDDNTNSHRFLLHLPVGFVPPRDQPIGAPIRAWPLIVYMHGSGGGAFFSFSRKSLQSEGLQFAAHNFVVVSPICEWDWKGSPGPWVAQLVEALKKCAWIDHGRTYLTGCSMGGMSCWEIGANTPWLFAALAPVAAHHKAEYRTLIAQRLCEKPIFCWHAEVDETCPLPAERPMWEAMQRYQTGKELLKTKIVRNVDHCGVYLKAYCETLELYFWFLKHSYLPPDKTYADS